MIWWVFPFCPVLVCFFYFFFFFLSLMIVSSVGCWYKSPFSINGYISSALAPFSDPEQDEGQALSDPTQSARLHHLYLTQSPLSSLGEAFLAVGMKLCLGAVWFPFWSLSERLMKAEER